MRRVLLVSHGQMAHEIKNSAYMITGTLDYMDSLSMSADEGLEGFISQLDHYQNKNHDEILILADLQGGTPYNACQLRFGHLSSVKIIAGLNLAMVIESMVTQSMKLGEAASYLVDIGKSSINLKADEDEADIDF